MVKWILSVVVVLVVAVDASADCGGRSIRSVMEKKPVLSFIAKLRVARTASCSSRESAAAASCSGPVAAPSCSQSVMSSAPAHAPAPAPVYEIFRAPTQAAPVCANGQCAIYGNVPVFIVEAPTPVRDVVRNTTMRLNEGAARFHSGMSSAYQQALASAQYRADNHIQGHSYLDTHRTSGVGWASNNSQPETCLGVGGCYAVVKGSDGWYATKFSE